MLVVLSSLAVLSALFPAKLQKRPWLPHNHSPHSSKRPLNQVIFKQNIPFKFSFANC